MRTATLFIAVLTGTACFSPSYPQDIQCGTPPDECPPGQQCYDGVCRSQPGNGPDGSSGGVDGSTIDSAQAQPDAAVDVPDAGPHACLVPASFGAATLVMQSAQGQGTAADPMVIALGGALNQDPMPDALQFELYKGFGVFAGGAIVPGSYQISGVELNYATCGVCVRVFGDFDQQTGETQQYLAQSGTITLTETSTNVVGSLTNMSFVEVTIDPQTFESTPVPFACTTAISSISFNAPVAYSP